MPHPPSNNRSSSRQEQQENSADTAVLREKLQVFVKGSVMFVALTMFVTGATLNITASDEEGQQRMAGNFVMGTVVSGGIIDRYVRPFLASYIRSRMNIADPNEAEQATQDVLEDREVQQDVEDFEQEQIRPTVERFYTARNVLELEES